MDHYHQNTWLESCEQLAAKLQVDTENSGLKVYLNPVHALKEVLWGLQQSFVHRKSVVVLQGATPWFYPIETMLMRDAYTVKKISVTESTGWLEKIPKDTLSVLIPEDHAMTAEYFDHQELVRELNDRKIFAIKWSHHKPFFSQFQYFEHPTLPYELKGGHFNNAGFSVVVHGKRARLHNFFTADLDWSKKITSSSIEKKNEYFSEVLKFENENSEDFRLLTLEDERLRDRVLFYLEGISGDELIGRWNQQLDFDINLFATTTHPCRWPEPGLWKWTGWDEPLLARLVILDARAFQQKGFRPPMIK